MIQLGQPRHLGGRQHDDVAIGTREPELPQAHTSVGTALAATLEPRRVPAAQLGDLRRGEGAAPEQLVVLGPLAAGVAHAAVAVVDPQDRARSCSQLSVPAAGAPRRSWPFRLWIMKNRAKEPPWPGPSGTASR